MVLRLYIPILILFAVYCLLDILQNGQLDGSLANQFPWLPVIPLLHIPEKLYLANWIRMKKKQNGEDDEKQTLKLLKRKHRSKATSK